MAEQLLPQYYRSTTQETTLKIKMTPVKGVIQGLEPYHIIMFELVGSISIVRPITLKWKYCISSQYDLKTVLFLAWWTYTSP